MIARFAIVGGKVQGVGFRWHARAEALRLGCTGWVMNRPDGTVEVHYQGATEVVDALQAWLADGPTAAHIDRVVAIDTAVDSSLTGFSIR